MTTVKRLMSGGVAVVVATAMMAAGSPAGAQAPDATIASVKGVHDSLKGFLMKSAAMVPADKYSYQPTKDVRTFGQLFGHVANASRMICGTASGMAAPQAADAEKLATKAEIEKALADAMAFCDHAFMMLNAQNANETVQIFGQTHSRIGGLAFNNGHNFEHYGNIVTYLRINGMVPPSSGGGGN